KSMDVEVALRDMRDEMGDEEYKSQVVNTIVRDLETIHERNLRVPHGTLTFGLELEVIPRPIDTESDKTSQRAAIDSIQDIGIPVIYDALREIPLPYSQGSHEQLEAVQELMKIGL